jgi:cytoskeletal protein CcmA (bactofilin family)
MFDKHKSNKPSEAPEDTASKNSTGYGAPVVSSPRVSSVIGSSIVIKGDVTGDENLIIEGKVEGKIDLNTKEVTVGSSGRVNANISAKVIKIDGEVKGDMAGNEKVIISKTGRVKGNIVAPRVTLEDGANFKGSIDMNPGEKASESSVTSIGSSVKSQATNEKTPEESSAKLS